ncbi:MAG: hypothetical protein ACRCTE_11285 [Cellulosilyticaceae bacterium]
MSYNLKILWITLVIVFLMLCMLIMPSVCIEGATFGLMLWFNKLLPSLLPFIILTQMLCGLGIVSHLSHLISPFTNKCFRLDGTSFVIFIIGLIAGYPTGAKMTKQLLDQQQISLDMAQKCLCFTNNCGPLFIIGTVGSILLKNVTLGYFLAFIHIFSALTLLLLSRFYTLPKESERTIPNTTASPSFVTVFNQAVQGGMDTIVYVGGYIIFFSMLSNILKHIPLFKQFILWLSSSLHLSFEFLCGLIYGSIEFSSGTALVTNSLAPTPQALALIAFILTFGGFCVFFQSSYVLQGSGLKLNFYLATKLFQALIAYSYTLLLYPLFFADLTTVPTLASSKLLTFLVGLLFLSTLLFRTMSHSTLPLIRHKQKYR